MKPAIMKAVLKPYCESRREARIGPRIEPTPKPPVLIAETLD